MSDKEIQDKLLWFIEAIKAVDTVEAAKDLQEQIKAFYGSNDIPEEKDVLAKSGFCEMLSMLAE